MRASLVAAVRLLGVGAVLLTGIAIVVGRSRPGVAEVRRIEAPRFRILSGPMGRQYETAPHLLDLETGTIKRLNLPKQDLISYASCAPWRDSLGRTHVV